MTARSIVIALLVAGLFGVASHSLGQAIRTERAEWPPEQADVYLLPSPDTAPLLSGGYREVSADVTWARALVYYGSSLTGDADFRYLERFIDNVMALDPRFHRVYKWASYSVTFQNERATQEEYRLAIKYLERGMEAFPDDYEFFWSAGIRYFLDLYSEDPDERQRYRERGAELMEQAMRKPNAPDTLASFAASLRMKLGQRQHALANLREMILLTQDDAAQAVLLRRYQSLAGEGFPEEARLAKRSLEERWRAELPWADLTMFIVLGQRPSPIIDFDQLATERDLFGSEHELPRESPEETQ